MDDWSLAIRHRSLLYPPVMAGAWPGTDNRL